MKRMNLKFQNKCYLVMAVFLIGILGLGSCNKNETKIENLSPQEDSLRIAMKNKHSFQEIEAIEHKLANKDITTIEVLSTFAPDTLLGIKRENISTLNNDAVGESTPIRGISGLYRQNNKNIHLNILDGAGNFSNLAVKNAVLMETLYTNQKFENGFKKSIAYKGKIMTAKQEVKNKIINSNLKFQLKERYFIDVYAENIPIDELKKVILEIDSTQLAD